MIVAYNYEALLKAYINHVVDREGIAFLEDAVEHPKLTDEQWQDLRKVLDDIYGPI